MSPCSGRTAVRSYSGEPTAARSTPSEARHAVRVSGGSGSPHSRIPRPPNGRSSISSSIGSARSARIASRITSGPIPSPPRHTTVKPMGAYRRPPMGIATTPTQRAVEEVDREFALLIDGEWVPAASGETFSCVDPFLEEPWGRVPVAGPGEVDRAVSAARRAFDEDGWPQMSPAARAALLRRLGDLIGQHGEELTRRQIRENGKLTSEMRPGVDVVAGDCHFFAGLAETVHGTTVPVSAPNFTAYTVREPIGVVAAITPWNTPLGLLGWKLFPALAAGNTVVVKPSEITPTSTLALGQLVLEAGFPPGVVNIVTGPGATGAALVGHAGVDKVAFTGSTA